MSKLIIALCLVLANVAWAQDAAAPMPPETVDASAARKACTDAMNADPAFAKSIVATADKQIDQRTIDAHQQAADMVAKNERHVILAYAAMWLIAALFVVFLWRRQQLLESEIAALRKDLEAAAKEGGA
jgi:C4-dicarboxylate-specific signal transduction histidine kinase